MKTSYWYARIETDAECYSIRVKSKREAKRQVKLYDHHTFGPIVKVTVEGRSLFEILAEALSEGGLHAESAAHYGALDSKLKE